MKTRVVHPEILDRLDPADSRALRSREDLRRINGMMGNFDWVMRELEKFPAECERGIVEIGAGAGVLTGWLARKYSLTGVDLVPRPESLIPGAQWIQGDLFTVLPSCEGDVLVGVMIVHHFSDRRLRDLGRMCEKFRLVCLCEPHRSRVAHTMGWIIDPLVNDVTRHDMHVSINAGFRKGELPQLLGLDSQAWHWHEDSHWRGGLRMLAWKP